MSQIRAMAIASMVMIRFWEGQLMSYIALYVAQTVMDYRLKVDVRVALN